MSSIASRKLNVGNRPMQTYMYLVSTYINQGIRRIILHGRGENISRAVDLYNLINYRLEGLVRLARVGIGTEEYSGRHTRYIELELEILR
ncbi:MAG: DNA-binding protein [Zestosphaera sp.]